MLYNKGIFSIGELESEPRLKYKKLEYNDLKEVQLYNSIKIEYGEYDEKKLHDNTWDGE